MSKKVMVISVHPDDETLGCGGTILKRIMQGYQVDIVLVTNISTEQGFSSERVESRQREIEIMKEKYGCNVHLMNLKSMELDKYNKGELVGNFSKVMSTIEPNIVYLPFKGDAHSDHRVVFEAAYSCTKTFRYPYIEEIYMIEVLSETDFAPALNENMFIPNVFEDISEFIDQKLEIMKIFSSEIAPPPFPRSLENIKSLARVRGSQSGFLFAESFMLLKQRKK